MSVSLITLVLFNIAIEHGPLIDDRNDELPIENGDVQHFTFYYDVPIEFYADYIQCGAP